jgi:hypothetical protein
VNAVNPGADEVCDAKDTDEDCDGKADDADSSVLASSQTRYYADADNDSYGDASSGALYCDDPSTAASAYVVDNTDCDDGNDDVNPGATERCDGVDTDCDASTPEDGSLRFTNTTGTSFYYPKSTIDGIFGVASAPYVSGLSSGTWSFCKGTYYMNFTPTTDMVIEGATGTVSDVIFSGGSTNKGVFTVGGTGTSFSVRDATIQDGEGTGTWYTSFPGSGGGVFCQGSSTSTKSLSLDNVMMENNKTSASTAGAGSAISAEFCDITMTDVDVKSNSGGNYGAIAAMSSQLDMDGVTIEANSHALISVLSLFNYGGGSITSTWKDVDIVDNNATNTTDPTYSIVVAGSGSASDIMTVEGEDVLIDQNTSATATAADHLTLWVGAASVSIEESSGSAGVTANDGVGVSLNPGGVFESTLADYGSSSTTNNETADIQTALSTYNPGVRSSFVCDEDTCGNDGDGDGDPSNDEFVCATGATSSSLTRTATGQYGALVKADRNSTIESFDVYMTGNANCSNDFYLMEFSSVSTSGSGKVLWRNLNVTNVRTTGWANSGHVGIPVTSGKYYASFVKTTCSSGSAQSYYACSSSGPKNAGFGNNYGFVWLQNTTEWALNSSQTIYGASSTCGFRTQYNLNDLDTSSNATCIP